MEITAEQYERIEDCLPVQRGNVRHQNLVLLNAILYVAEHGYKWRGLPKRYGNWHSIGDENGTVRGESYMWHFRSTDLCWP